MWKNQGDIWPEDHNGHEFQGRGDRANSRAHKHNEFLRYFQSNPEAVNNQIRSIESLPFGKQILPVVALFSDKVGTALALRQKQD